MKTAIGLTGGITTILANSVIQIAVATGHPLTTDQETLVSDIVLGLAGIVSLTYAWWSHRQTKTALTNIQQGKIT